MDVCGQHNVHHDNYHNNSAVDNYDDDHCKTNNKHEHHNRISSARFPSDCHAIFNHHDNDYNAAHNKCN